MKKMEKPAVHKNIKNLMSVQNLKIPIEIGLKLLIILFFVYNIVIKVLLYWKVCNFPYFCNLKWNDRILVILRK